MRRFSRHFTHGVILACVFVLVSHPVLVAAQPVQEPAPSARSVMVEAGDRYLTSTSAMVGSAAALLRGVDEINATPVEDLSESILEAARGQAQDLAAQAAEAIGATADLADSIGALDDTYFVPVDLSAEADQGLPAQLVSDLQDKAGLSSSQVQRVADSLDSVSAGRLHFGGIPSGVRATLVDAGLGSSDIDNIEGATANRGLANGGIANGLGQFRASQDEFAGARTRALILDSQLLTREIAVRQSQGIAPRPVSQAELDALANDELRLLIHIAQLQALWGEDPSQDVGEGQWWFVERYADRSAERLQDLTLDSQNLGLIGELFLVRNLAELARTARSGDAAYAKHELDAFAVLLQVEIGDETFVSDQRDSLTWAGKAFASLAARPEVRQAIAWPVSWSDRSAYVEHAQVRLDQQGVKNLLDLVGAIDESDETNNELDYLFAAGLPYFGQLSADILLGAINIISVVNQDNVEKWIVAILTGDTDDPALLIGSVLFGLLPVIGVIQDIYTLVTDPSVVIKAISLIGVVGGIVELSSFIPGLQPVGLGGILGKASSTVMKGLEKAAEIAEPAFRGVARALRLEDAFDVMTDLLRVTIKGVSDFPSSLDEVVTFVQDLFSGARHLWDDFVAFVERVGPDLLVRMGFDEGSALVGGIIRRGGHVADDFLPVVDDLGDGLARAGARLTDDAEEGVVKVLDTTLDSSSTRRMLERAGGACATAALPGGKVGLAAPMPAGVCDPELLNKMLKNLDDWDEAAWAGFDKLQKIDGDSLGELMARYADSPDALKQALGVVGRYDFTGWDSKTLGSLADFLGDFGSQDTIEYILGRMLTGEFDEAFDIQFSAMLGRMTEDSTLRKMLAPNVSDDIRNGLLDTLRRAEHPNTPPQFVHGANFQISRGEYYFQSEQLVSFEQSRLDMTLLTDGGPVIEAKYWRNGTILADIEDAASSRLINQIRDYSLTNRRLIVEFGQTVEDGVQVSTIQKLRALLDSAGVNLDKVEFVIVDSHLFMR